MRETAERRAKLMKILCRRRKETIGNLAEELGVSERTVRRDIEVLSLYEPIYTQTGRHGGGVYVQGDYSIDRMYMAQEEIAVLQKLLVLAERQPLLDTTQMKILESLISAYAKPHTGKELSAS